MPNQFYIHVEGVRDDCWCLSEVSWVWSRVTYWVGEPESYSAVTDRVWLLSQYEVKWRQNVSSCTWGAWPGWQRIYAKCLWRVILQDRRVSQSRKGQIAPSSKVAKTGFGESWRWSSVSAIGMNRMGKSRWDQFSKRCLFHFKRNICNQMGTYKRAKSIKSFVRTS